MTALRLFTLLLILFGGQANAAEIAVRSGAHPSFTRLVLDVPAGAEWAIEQQASDARITMIGHSGGFDISRVFERIDRSIVGAIEANSSSIKINFACECQANVFRSGDRMIVIDVRKTGQLRQEPPPRFEETFLQFVGSAPLRFSGGTPVDLIELDQQPVVEETLPDIASPAPDLTDSLEDPTSNLLRPETSAATELEGLQIAQKKLAERVGLAATTGILRSTRRPIESIEPDPTPQIDTSVFDTSLDGPQSAPIQSLAGSNIRISSSSDLPGATTGLPSSSTTQGMECLDRDEVGIQDWGGQTAFATSIGNLRRSLFSERDTANNDAVLELVRRYLYFGFGAEALETLSIAPELMTRHRALKDMARVMEYGSAGSSSYLAHFADCDSEVALWAILSTEAIESSDNVNSDAALRALSSLPLHLRRFLAPTLSERLLAYGDQDAAMTALRGLERAPEPLPAAAQLVMANIELEQGGIHEAQGRLKEVISSNEQQSAEALIRYVDTSLDANVDIAQDIATLVEAYATEMRNDPLGQELRRTHVLALAKSGQFSAAFEALEQTRPTQDANSEKNVRSSLMTILAADADDAIFVKHTFESMQTQPMDVSLQAKIKLIARLAELGFHTEAEMMISMHEGFPVTAENRVLRAKISLGLGRPSEALAFLGELKNEEADRLRADAKARMGEYREAHALYETLDNEDARIRVAWLSDDWRQLLRVSDPVLGAIVSISKSEMNTSDEIAGMLERTQDTLAESARARNAIQELLSLEVGSSGD
ncbi:MAG: hypothetical protein AAFQ58_07850 [Pseudomonadota bacterium]